MDASFSDFTSSIRYGLTSRSVPGGGVEIVLDLFRGAVPALTRTIASVRASEAAPLLATCHRHLERLGAHAVTNASADFAPEPINEADWTAPVAAFGWVFTP